MSTKLNIYNDLDTALSAVTGINTVQIWNNQVSQEDVERARTYNCAYVEFSSMGDYVTKQETPKHGTVSGIECQKRQSADYLITIHFVFWKTVNETVAFQEIDSVLQAGYLAVQNLTGTYYSPLLRVEERQDVDHNQVLDWQMDFTTHIDDAGEVDSGLVEVDADTLSLSITKDLDVDNYIVRSGDGEA